MAFFSKSCTSYWSKTPPFAAKSWANGSLASSITLFWWHDNSKTDIMFRSTMSASTSALIGVVVEEGWASTSLVSVHVISFSDADTSDMFVLSDALRLQHSMIKCRSKRDCPPSMVRSDNSGLNPFSADDTRSPGILHTSCRGWGFEG